jgi:hypothetical protein
MIFAWLNLNLNLHGGIEKIDFHLHGLTVKIEANHKKTFARGAKK